MDSSRSSLPNVDRANSTLFKRYLEEQHKSVVTTNHYQQTSRPLNSTIEITHTHRQQQAIYTTTINSNNHPPVLVKRKCSTGRKPAGDTANQRTSHTSRFMKRFQRQHKNGETINNVQKRDGRPRFEFHDSTTAKETGNEEATRCTCLAASDRNQGEENHQHRHHHHCPAKTFEVPRLSLNGLSHTTSQHRRQPNKEGMASTAPPQRSRSPLPMLPPTLNDSVRQALISNSSYLNDQNSLISPSIEPTMTMNTEFEPFFLDPPTDDLSTEAWSLINDRLQEISIELSNRPNVDLLLEIEESLAQRIYDCIVEQDDENENDTKSYSTLTNDSSLTSTTAMPPPLSNNITSQEYHNLPPSPMNTTVTELVDSREQYFKPIREQPTTSFNALLDRNRHSTPFNPLSKQIQNDTRSPFAQSLFEPMNLLRTVTTNNKDDNEEFGFFPPSFSFDHHPNINIDFQLSQQKQSTNELSTTSYHQTLPFFNPHHLLPPRTTPMEKNLSAFKPVEPANVRSTTSFALKRPHVINNSTGLSWFGQS